MVLRGGVTPLVKVIFPLLKTASLAIKATDAVYLAKSITVEDWETKFIIRNPEQEFKITNDVNISSQKEFDDLFNVNIVLIEDNLVIDSKNSNDPVRNLEGLANLREVKGDFIIRNTAVKELPLFHQLEEVVNTFEISQNNQLEKINGFNVLRKSKWNFFITDNESLHEIVGFDNLYSVTGDLVISGNKALKSIRGFNAVQEVGGDFQWISVIDNALIELDAFNAISNTPITLEDENELRRIQAFKSLKRSRHFKVKNCPNLSDLSNFSKLETVIQNFEISGLGIVNTDDFTSLTELSAFPLRIKNNIELIDVCRISDVLINSAANSNASIEMTGNGINFTIEELLAGTCN